MICIVINAIIAIVTFDYLFVNVSFNCTLLIFFFTSLTQKHDALPKRYSIFFLLRMKLPGKQFIISFSKSLPPGHLFAIKFVAIELV